MAEIYLTPEQVAERLQLSPITIRRQLKRGALRGIKKGRVWRVPESALAEPARASTDATQADTIWREINSSSDERRDEALRLLFHESQAVQTIVRQRSAESAALYYATREGSMELSDWRALDDEPFHDDPEQDDARP